ncbi:MAG: DUF4145 domain-containing protein [Chloroflexota bacterium]|nr:DUF4145 domain-containing protein [Chloroflexota bacterium]
MTSKDRIICRRCNQITNHEIVRKVTRTFTPIDYPEMQIDYAEGKWEILECRGCGEVTFRETWVTSEDYDPRTGDEMPDIKLYPCRGKGLMSDILPFAIPSILKSIYQETVGCYNSGNYILCAAGIRALVEGISVHLGVNGGIVTFSNEKQKKQYNLQGKIEGLVENDYLTREHADSLHELRFLGNEAIHKLQSPSEDELRLVFSILYLTLENIFALSDKATLLKLLRSKRIDQSKSE